MGALLDHLRASGVALTALPGDRLQASGAITDAIRATIREHKAAILAELAANDATVGTHAPINKPAILGELSAALPKITGEHLPNVRAAGHLGKREVLSGAGISSSSANEYERIAAIPESDFEAHIAEHRDAREQATELRELVGIVAADWPDDERAEALAAALADPEAALVCFRALASEREGATADRREPAPADMRPCVDCASYTPSGRCLAAWRGESFGAGIATSRTWTPTEPERPQRCGAYAPGPNDPDRRSGRERWPMLMAR